MLSKGTIVADEFRIDGVLGVGGMGVVYEAWDSSLERTIALKLISSELGSDPGFRERFRREGMIQAAMEHPHIIPVHRAGESDQGLFIAMRLVRGRNLKDIVVASDLPPERAVRLLGQVAGALDAAHEVGLIHRDIKPYNILVDDRRDHAYLADFGITKLRTGPNLTKTRQMVGTPDYMAPEQILGETPTERTDIYSFGVVVFECFTGNVPFERNTDWSVLNAHLHEPVPSVAEFGGGLPPALDDVIGRAMAKKPEDRYPTATELVRDMERALFDGRAAPTQPPFPAAETAASETLVGPGGTPATGPGAPAPPTEVPAADETVLGPYTPPPDTEAPAADETVLQPYTPAPETLLPPADAETVLPAADAEPAVPAADETLLASTSSATEAPVADETVLQPYTPPPETDVPAGDETALSAPTPATPVTDETVLSRSSGAATTPGVEPAKAPAGPTQAAPTPVHVPPIERERPGRTGRMLYAAAGVALAVALVGGFLAGRATGGGEASEPQSSSGSASSGDIAISFPDSWRRSAQAPTIPGLTLGSRVALASRATPDVGLVAGTVPQAWPTFLPESFRKLVPEKALSNQGIVRLGGLQAFSYADLKPKGFGGTTTVFTIPQAGEATTALVCFTKAGGTPAFVQCPSIANRISIDGASSYRLSLPEAYGAKLRSTITTLEQRRARDLRALRNATTNTAQAKAARSISADYGSARDALRRARATPYVRPAHRDIVAALAATREAYGKLADAASAASSSRYDSARNTVKKAEQELEAAVDQMRDLGFRVS